MLTKLLSGSDVRGRALGEDAPLTVEIAYRLGAAFTRWLSAKSGAATPKIAVGRDPRLSGEALAAAFIRGANAQGARMLDFGLCTTPAMFIALLSETLALDASVMVTASHLPADRNGFKFITREGGLASGDTREILAIAADEQTPPPRTDARAETYDFLPEYQAALKACAPEGLSGLRVAVDAGNGAGGFYAELLESLGADTRGSVHLAPDGRFPAHAPNPEDETAMAAASAATVAAGADIGVIFDADCDRAAIISGDGRELGRNRLLALASALVLRKAPGATIVTDSVTSTGLTQFIQARGGVHHRFKRGYKNVIDEAKRLNAMGVDCPLAIETSGHAAFRDNHFLDDGMYLATLLLCEAARQKRAGGALADLISDLREPVERCEIRLPITDPDFRAAGARVIAALEEGVPGARIDTGNREGVRLLFDEGFLMLRLSVHDPVLPMNVESDVQGGLKRMLAAALPCLARARGVDITPIQQYYQNIREDM